MDYELIKSKRRTIALEIKPDGRIVVRAPKNASKTAIDDFVNSKARWINSHLEKINETNKATGNTIPLTEEKIKELAKKAKASLPQKVSYYANMLGVSYGKIFIKCQSSLWGSCSSKGNLNFNCLLMLLPEEIADYVVVHELSHRLQMNHSPKFWAIVESIIPDFKERRKYLKENGGALITAAQNARSAAGKKYYTYILRCADNSLYTGYTTDLDNRLKAHNSGKGAKYTKTRLPVSLVYYETFSTKQEATSREALIKQLSKKEKEMLIKKNLKFDNKKDIT